MTLTSFTFEELDAILLMMEMHEWTILAEHLEVDIEQLYDKIGKLRDEVECTALMDEV